MLKRVLCLLMDGFEEIETVTPVDLLRRAGAEVVLASMTDSMHLTGRTGIVLRADARLQEFDAHDFDALFIPGGPAVKSLRADGRAASLAKTFAVDGKLVAAICAGPLVLQDASLLAGRRYTAHDSTYAELTLALAQERVVQDGNLITSRGAGTALEFGLALVQHLFGQEQADKVAAAIMA
jgi:4-methyl-5(b-hydroxyethyl)-thiazole monophosphate biosynthesis